MTQTATYKEKIAGLVVVLSVLALIVIYFCPSKGNPEVTGGIVAAFLLSFSDGRHYLFSSTSGSQAKDDASAESNSKLIDALANSAPVKN